MSLLERLPPTRLGLLRGRRQAARVARGVELVRRKREALVTELFRAARPAADARQVMAARAARAYPALLGALAAEGGAGVRTLGWPERSLEVVMRPARVWGIAFADLAVRAPARRSLEERGVTAAGAGPAVVEAAEEFEVLTDLLLDAAPKEQLLRRLAGAVARSSRQLRVLEQRVQPALAASLARVRQTLEEREREEHGRLRHVARRTRAMVESPTPAGPFA